MELMKNKMIDAVKKKEMQRLEHIVDNVKAMCDDLNIEGEIEIIMQQFSAMQGAILFINEVYLHLSLPELRQDSE